MADPFSIAGTAVGITSLGIQVCQGLFQYYVQFRGLHDDIDDVLGRVEGLEGILKNLELLIKKFGENDNEVPSQLQVALTACEKAFQRLRKMAEKRGETKEPSSVQDRLRLAKKRLQWPFKRDTLLELQDTLNGFQDNLLLALQSLGLDENLNRLEKVQSTTDTVLEHTVRVEQHVSRNTASLESLHQQMHHLSLDQRQQHSTLSADLSTHLGTQLALHTTSIEQKLDLLISNSHLILNAAQTDSRLLLDASRTIQDVTPQFRKTLTKYNSLRKPNGTGQMKPSSCTCSWLSGKRQSWSRWRTITLHTKESYTHQPDCPCHAHADFSKAVEARFNLKLYWLQYYVQAGWQMSRDRGWRNIQPILRYRAVVPNDSPVFALFKNDDYRYNWKLVEQENYQQNVETKSRTILNTLIRSFGNGASPTDVNEQGETILHVALKWLGDLELDGFYDHKFICSFIDACIAEGVPCDEVNEYGETLMSQWQWTWLSRYSPLDSIQGISRDESARAVFGHLAKRVDGWSIRTCVFDINCRLYDTVTEVLSSEESSNRMIPPKFDVLAMCLSNQKSGLSEDDSLLVTILRRSKAEFLSQIKTYDPESLVTIFADRGYARALTSWPIGLRMLISNTPDHAFERLLALLWVEALSVDSLNSMQLLLQFGVKPSIKDWETLHNKRFLSHNYGRDHKKYKEHYRQICLTMAEKYFDGCSNDDECVPTTQACCKNLQGYGLYHTPFLSLTATECLWDAGHRDIDTVRTHWRLVPATPLWMMLVNNYYEWMSKWHLAEWLMEKGADITWTHPAYLTTPAHIIGGILVGYIIKWHAFGSLSKLHSILLCSTSDRCTCYCSHLQSGCYTIGCAVRCPSREDDRRTTRERNADYKKHVGPHVYALVDSHRSFRWMSSAILRVMTFDKLSLTHTCCFKIRREARGWTARPTKEEAEEIYDIEREDIKLLDTLMAEFEVVWDTYQGTFGEFMKEVWKPRMGSIRKEPKDVEDIYQETGVRLRQTEYWSGSDTETSDSEDDDSSSPASTGSRNRFTTLEDDDSEGKSEE